MNEPLNEDSRMECPKHGTQKPSMICQHLQHGDGLGFYISDNKADDELSWLDIAWCKKCDEVYQEEGEWNDISEEYCKPLFICKGCFDEVRKRNE